MSLSIALTPWLCLCAQADAKHNAEIQRRMHPRTRDDFEILYNELENWRQHETKRIEESGLPEIERLEALAQLLHKQTKLLQTIDRLKITATKVRVWMWLAGD